MSHPSRSLPCLAFLGPVGTYSHQAAYELCGDSVKYEEKRTIADTFHSLSPQIPFALVPQENSIHGSVLETYDLLRLSCAGQNRFVRDETVLKVQHCLLVRKGTALQGITQVISHEQALGQCTRYLSANMPQAARVKVPSTACAAEALSKANDVSSVHSAVICSKICATIYDDLEVLAEGIQNEKHNLTRFWLLSTSPDTPLPYKRTITRHPRALFRLSAVPPGEDDKEHKVLNLTKVIQKIPNTIRIDRRPSILPLPFHDVYFVETQAESPNDPSADEPSPLATCAQYVAELKRIPAKLQELGVECSELGVW